MNALADPQVGKYLNEHFVSAFQKVATFRVVNGQKQGGNVASYFAAPDGRVLHVVAGPVDAGTLLREARWVVETTRRGIEQSKGDGAAFKAFLRTAHAERLQRERGLVVRPVTFDPPQEQDPNSALSYNDPTGQPLAPRLPPPPIDGPDVTFRTEAAAGAVPREVALADGLTRRRLDNQARVHQLLAAHALVKIEALYGSVFEQILGERVSTKPVEVVTPFPWVQRGGKAR